MIHCRLALCAEKIIQDAQTAAVTIVTLLERIVPSAFPMVLPSYSSLFFVNS